MIFLVITQEKVYLGAEALSSLVYYALVFISNLNLHGD